MMKLLKYSLILILTFFVQTGFAQDKSKKEVTVGDVTYKIESFIGHHDNGEISVKYDYYSLGEVDTTGQEQIVLHGIKETYYKNGKINKRMHVSHGELDGLLEVWYDNGKKLMVCDYKNNLKNGSFQSWYKDGTKNMEGSFVDGEQKGNWKTYDIDGTLLDDRDL